MWSRSQERRDKAAADFSGIRAYATVEELLADPAIDVVAVVTPHHTHRDLTVQALRAGKHVVVDKAMACTVAECTEMIEVARECGKTLAVFHNRRHDGNFRRIQQLVSDDVLGEVFHVECHAGGFGAPARGWYSEQRASGGIMHLWGRYYRDLAAHLLDGAPVPVSAECGRRTIAVLEAANRSCRNGCTAVPDY